MYLEKSFHRQKKKSLDSLSDETRVRLFCFPYAGGSARIFGSWSKYLPKTIEVCPVELPGRGKRIAEPLCVNLPMLLEDLVLFVLQRQEIPFAFFGHSLGALIAFELTRQLRRCFRVQPLCLFVSAYAAPHFSTSSVARNSEQLYNLPDLQFIDKLRQFNGTPDEVLSDSTIMELMMPVLRADFSITETYTYTSEAPLNCPIIAFGGLKDSEVELSTIKAWQKHTANVFTASFFPGDHFFLRTDTDILLQQISLEIKNALRKSTNIRPLA